MQTTSEANRIWPVAGWATGVLCLCSLLGWFGIRSIHHSLEIEVETELTTILRTSSLGLEFWLDGQTSTIRSLALQTGFHEELLEVVRTAPDLNDQELTQIESVRALSLGIRPILQQLNSRMFLLTDRTGRTLASSHAFPPLGTRLPKNYATAVEHALQGEIAVVPPHRCPLAIPDQQGKPELFQPSMVLLIPLADKVQQDVEGVLCLFYDPRDELTRMLGTARSGKSGETYAVNSEGLLLTESRFETQLRETRLLAVDASSTLMIEVRDPGHTFSATNPNSESNDAGPLTRAAAGIAELSTKDGAQIGSQTQPYRDYRGVEVVGAWQWLPRFNFGVITELDADDAFAITDWLSTLLWFTASVLVACVWAAMLASQFQQQHLAKRQTAGPQKLGQYQLLEVIGQGGMGEVYRARHDTLQRETAVKLIRTQGNEVALNRFEREVQLTCRLQHPNTIQIYDYGRDKGVFYYAMELLEGISLEELVREFGPLRDGRAMHILAEICWAIGEAHDQGLVHRDIKPANIMICHRGGIPDAVKVLDFGLARSLTGDAFETLAQEGTVAGTPAYMSPESAKTPNLVDQRSDIYSMGSIAFFLLTGKPPFLGSTPLETIRQTIQDTAPPVTDSAPYELSSALAELVMQCLEKKPDDRPSSVHDIRRALLAIQPCSDWNLDLAESWWQTYRTHKGPDESKFNVRS